MCSIKTSIYSGIVSFSLENWNSRTGAVMQHPLKAALSLSLEVQMSSFIVSMVEKDML